MGGRPSIVSLKDTEMDYVFTTYPEAMVQDIIYSRIRGLATMFYGKEPEFVLKFDMKTAIKDVLDNCPAPSRGWIDEYNWEGCHIGAEEGDPVSYGRLWDNLSAYGRWELFGKDYDNYDNLFTYIENSIEEDKDGEFKFLIE